MNVLARLLGKPQPLTGEQQARIRLSQIVEATRNSYATQRFIRAREAALRGAK